MVSEPLARPAREEGGAGAGNEPRRNATGSAAGLATPEGEVERARAVLKQLIELSGMSQREVKSRLVEQGFRTDLFRVVSGKLELRLRHIVEVCRVLEIHLSEFCRIVFGAPATPSVFMRRLEGLIHPRATLAPAAAPPRAVAGQLAEVERELRRLTAEVERLKAQARRGGGG